MQTIALPSHFASALINNDFNGLTGNDIKELNNELKKNNVNMCNCLSCGNHYIGRLNGVLTDLIDYDFNLESEH